MTKKPFTHRLFILCSIFFLLGSSYQAKASHAMGADLGYECIDPINHVYKVTLHFYRDCEGIAEPDFITLTYASASCGQNLTVDLVKQACPPNTTGGQPCEVSPLCFASVNQSTCNGGTLPGVESFTYTATVTLPTTCPDWVFSFSECCRNNQVTNLANASGEDLYVQATLNNAIAGCNSSPAFTTLPVPYICTNQSFFYNHGAVDADGDSLVYSLVNPLGALAAPILYNTPFSPTNPMNISGSFSFSSTTGQMNFTPNGVQVAVVTVLVSEYRNGVLIGTTMRDIQIVVVNLPGCANPAPTFSGVDSASVQGGYFINHNLVQVCPGNTLTFTTLARELTGDSIFMESNVAQAIPAAQYTSHYISLDSIAGNFTWTPTGLDTGQNTFIITVRNDNCPLASNQAYAITIDVLAGTYAGPDISYCPAGGPVQLQAYGGSQFTWSPTSGLNNANVGNPTAAPAQTTTYIVTSNLSSSCKNQDTVTVYRVPDFNYTVTQSKDTICRFEVVNLNVTPDPGFGPYTYQWTPALGLNATTIPNPLAQPDFTTTYTLTISSDTGCVIHDTTTRIVVSGQGPSVQITADKYKVCVGDTIHLTSDISTLPCGLNVVPCTGNFGIKTIGSGTQSAISPYRGLWEDGRMQILFRASELQAMGMQAGTITDLAFDVSAQGSSQPYSNFTVKMGCTNLSELSAYVPGLSVVLSDPGFSVTGTGFANHNLNSPYDWDGQSNLIVEACFDNNSWTGDDAVNGTATGFNSVLYSIMDNSSGCNLSAPTIDQLRPNVQFVYCIAPPKTLTYAWNPTTNLHSPDSLNPFVVLNQSTTYVLNAYDGTCNGGSSVTLSIDTSFNISAGPDVPFCTGVAAQLNSTVTGTPPTGGVLNCGVHNTACSGSPVVKTITPSGSFSSTNTLFQGTSFGAQREDERTQILYRASDLLAAGFTKGTISQIGFNITTKASLFPFQNISIKMGCTVQTELNDTTWEPTTLVYTNILYSTVVGWNDFALQTNFDWDGNTNIVIEVCWDNPDGFPFGGEDDISAGFVTYNNFHTGTAVSSVGCNLPVPTFELYQLLPELRAKICPPPPLPVTYIWTPASGLSSNNIANPKASPATPTVYTVTAYFGGSCPKADSVLVTPQNFAHVVSNDTGICQGYSAQLNALGGNSYTWTPATNLSCTNCPNPIASPDSTTTYYLQTLDTLTGCRVNDTVVVSVQNLNATALFTDTLVDQGTALTIGVTAVGGSGNYSYVWSPADYLSDVHAANPLSTPLADVLYVVTVSSGPCADTASVNVRVNIIESPIAVPNAFSPNGDGKNDGFYPVINNAIAKVKTFRVYNRYGQMVHDSDTPWDGKFKNTDQPAGTFIYYIVVQRPYKDDEKLQGSFTLLR